MGWAGDPTSTSMSKPQIQRAFVVAILALAAAMIVREVMHRGQGRELLEQRQRGKSEDDSR